MWWKSSSVNKIILLKCGTNKRYAVGDSCEAEIVTVKHEIVKTSYDIKLCLINFVSIV